MYPLLPAPQNPLGPLRGLPGTVDPSNPCRCPQGRRLKEQQELAAAVIQRCYRKYKQVLRCGGNLKTLWTPPGYLPGTPDPP